MECFRQSSTVHISLEVYVTLLVFMLCPQCLRLPVHYQPYYLISSLANEFNTITSSSDTVDAWLKEVSQWLEVQSSSPFSKELLALLLSGLFIRAINVSGNSDGTVSLLAKVFCRLAKAYPTIVGFVMEETNVLITLYIFCSLHLSYHCLCTSFH